MLFILRRNHFRVLTNCMRTSCHFQMQNGAFTAEIFNSNSSIIIVIVIAFADTRCFPIRKTAHKKLIIWFLLHINRLKSKECLIKNIICRLNANVTFRLSLDQRVFSSNSYFHKKPLLHVGKERTHFDYI